MAIKSPQGDYYPRRTRRGPVEARPWRSSLRRATTIRDVRVAAPLKRGYVGKPGAPDPLYPRRTRRGPVEAASRLSQGIGVERLSATYASRPR